ncbi:MAG: hypothetical protein ACR2G2_14810 [Pseudonocardia sp.]
MSTFSATSARTPREAPRVGAYRRGSRVRTTRAGTWFPAVGPDEEPAGLLLLHPAVKPGVLLRTIGRLAELALPGVLPMLPDLVDQAGRDWLVATTSATPTLADLLDDGSHRTAGNAAALLSDVATTLIEVHAAGLAHGAVEAQAVVLGSEGTALLADWGTDGQASPEGDLAAWNELAELLVERWCIDSDTAAAGLARAVHVAGQPGPGGTLRGALDQLRELAQQAQRDVLAEAAVRPIAPARRRRPPNPAPARPFIDSGDAAPSVLDVRPTPFPNAPPRLTPSPRATPRATPAPTTAPRTGPIPTVPTRPTAPHPDATGWQTPVEPVPLVPPADTPPPPVAQPPPRQAVSFATKRSALLAIVLALVLVGATAVLVRPFEPAKKPATAASIGPLEIRAVSVSAELRSPVCLLVGIVTTNGQPGRVVYRWVGENGSQAVTSVSTPADNYQIEIGMIWAPSSPPLHGSSITLQILEPKPSTTAAPVPLSCI